MSEGAIARAANGWLVAAQRTDMPPQYVQGKHNHHLEGTAICISKDDGKTWSEMSILFYAGRHHANLQSLPNGDLVCTMVVRMAMKAGDLASHRRGSDVLVSKDTGLTGNLKERYELDACDYYNDDNWARRAGGSHRCGGTQRQPYD